MANPTKQLKAMEVSLAAISGLDRDEQAWVLEWLARNLGIAGPLIAGAQPETPPQRSTAQPPAPHPQSGGAGPAVTAKLFMATKKPETDVDRIVCLALFLSRYKGMAKFKTKNLTDLARDEAAQPKFSNAAQAVANATRAKFLAPAGGGMKQVTLRGENYVDSMPDKEKMKAVLASQPSRRRRKATRSKKARPASP